MKLLDYIRAQRVMMAQAKPTPRATLDNILAAEAGRPHSNAIHELVDESVMNHLNDAMNAGLSRDERIASADKANALLALKSDIVERVRHAQEEKKKADKE